MGVSNLTGSKVKDVYSQLVHIPDLDGSLRPAYTGTGTVLPTKYSTGAFGVDNLQFDGNTISTTDTNSNLILAGNGTGSVSISKVAITAGTVSGLTTPLPVASGGTGSATAGDARTALGLGTIAVQSASSVTITGGAMSGVTLSGAYTGMTNILVTGTIGYTTGAGGTVTQATSKSTGVTLNKAVGQITMHNASLASATSVSFTLTNSTIVATDVVVVNIASGGTADSYNVTVQAVASGTCSIQVRNVSGGSLGEALVLNFAVVKGASA